MIQIAGHLKLPILVTEQYVKGLGSTVPQIKEILAGLNAYNPIEKTDFSCFGEEDFDEAFEESKIQTLAIIGIEAHVCVMQTALDAVDRGINVFVAAEATGSRNPRHKEEAIARLRDFGAIAGSVEMFAFEMMRTSAHPAFKQVQKVIL
jgi:nicotinamidase-related amidase